MSKSLGNFVAINEPAGDMFGKLMSIPDEVMEQYGPPLLGGGQLAGQHPRGGALGTPGRSEA